VKETLAHREGFLVNNMAESGWTKVTRYGKNGVRKTKYTRGIIVCTVKVKQTRYRSGVAQRVPES
jgi:hypothetical protein